MTARALRIGTRGSPLALIQARMVASALAGAAPAAPPAEIVPIRTTGDMTQDRPLSDIGGKGLFTKELDQALDDGRIDVAVHSMKDVPTILPDGHAILAVLPRADPRDAFLSRTGDTLDTLAPGSVVGTVSLRRQALVRIRRPDVEVRPLRGNVDTRIAKMQARAVDATLLAMAGLDRLGRLAEVRHQPLDPDQMLPAVAQGAIGIQALIGRADLTEPLARINCLISARRIAVERGFLAALDGSCRTPIAAYADSEPGGKLTFRGLVALPDGTKWETIVGEAAPGMLARQTAAHAFGFDLGLQLAARLSPEFRAGLGPS